MTNKPAAHIKRALLAIYFLALSFFLTACASTRLIDSDVTAFSAWTTAPPAPGTPYRFERLPSQQAQAVSAVQQDQVEALAIKALARVGMVLDAPAARFSVQVVLNSQLFERFSGEGLSYGGTGIFLGASNFGGSVGFATPLRFGELYFKRDVTLLMRDLVTQKVVFETRALHDGPWSNTLQVLPAMLDAALLGFPQPVLGTRRIDVQIPLKP